jgi:hypothetical protein
VRLDFFGVGGGGFVGYFTYSNSFASILYLLGTFSTENILRVMHENELVAEQLNNNFAEEAVIFPAKPCRSSN